MIGYELNRVSEMRRLAGALHRRSLEQRRQDDAAEASRLLDILNGTRTPILKPADVPTAAYQEGTKHFAYSPERVEFAPETHYTEVAVLDAAPTSMLHKDESPSPVAKTAPKYPIVQVVWSDSCIQSAQVGPREFPEVAIIRTCGYLVRETEDSVTVARDGHDDEDCRGIVTIPKHAVRIMECVRERSR